MIFGSIGRGSDRNGRLILGHDSGVDRSERSS